MLRRGWAWRSLSAEPTSMIAHRVCYDVYHIMCTSIYRICELEEARILSPSYNTDSSRDELSIDVV